jgi:DNA adenine methylase
MRYFGGKQRIARHLAAVMEGYQFTSYWEPFCGACSVMERISAPTRIASDVHIDLILLWQALKRGWVPPRELSLEEYTALKTAEPSGLRAFAGFGCSNSGRWFEGWAHDSTGRNYALNAHNSLVRKIRNLGDVEFRCCDYWDLDHSLLTRPLLVYCDPPYAASTKKYAAGAFDVSAFWDWVRELSNSATVLVSEYKAPEDFEAVWTRQVKTDLKSASGAKYQRVEALFRRRDP